MENNNEQVVETKNLIKAHIAIWGETDATKRLQLTEGIYSEDILVIDPEIILNGRSEVSNFIDSLLSQHPGFVFDMVKEIETHHDSAILSWQFGPATKPDTITGQDIFTITDGEISKLIVFVNGATT